MNETFSNYLEKSYYDWLTDMIDCDDKTALYESLLLHLYYVEYVWMQNIPLDENRAIEGLEMRKRFAEMLSPGEAQQFIDILANKPCSILEMLVAFSERLTQVVNLEKYQFFWMFIDNLGLGWATDYDYDEGIVNDILYDFMHGTIHGNEPIGNEHPPVLFPCREVYLNMNSNLFFQANLYLNHYFL